MREAVLRLFQMDAKMSTPYESKVENKMASKAVETNESFFTFKFFKVPPNDVRKTRNCPFLYGRMPLAKRLALESRNDD